MPWQQQYNPLHNMLLSTLAALIPVVVLLGSIALLRLRAHYAALLGLFSAILISSLVFHAPATIVGSSLLYGAAFGLLPIGWIILNVIFLYRLAHEKGLFTVLQTSLTRITRDQRLQLLLVAFCFGSFFEGAAGFGAPVAVTASILIGLGFPPLSASGLSLIANTAPVAFGALGTPLIALQGVTGLDLRALSATVGLLLTPFALLIPFWLIWAFAGFKRMLQVWPALLLAGGTFAITQYLVAKLHGPWLVDIIAALLSIGVLVAFLLVWQPSQPMLAPGFVSSTQEDKYSSRVIFFAWLPWIILSLCVFAWGVPQIKSFLDIPTLRISVPGLDGLVLRVPPVVSEAKPEAAVFAFNWLSATGTAILLSAILTGLLIGYTPRKLLQIYGQAILQVRFSLLTIASMMALGFVTRYSGLDGTLGLAFSRTGGFYPFFGTLLGWLGVALTGSDTSSNVLFGSLQRISAEQIGLDPLLMASANSAGGVMGKMIDAQSIVVASTATGWYGHESEILRFVFFHSLALAGLVGLLVMAFAYGV